MKKIIFVMASLLLFQTFADAGLFEYIAREDASFEWEKVGQEPLPNGAVKIDIKLISQTWQGIVWEHRLRLVVPGDIKSPSLASIYITGSGGGRDELLIGSAVASALGSPVAILHDVPYQPLFGGLKEDELIAYTILKAMETGDEEWVLLLPMAKTAVRAMDAIQEFSKQKLGVEVNGFVIGGGSKRGWTTWLSAAVDERVKGIIPASIDLLDIPRQMEHQLEVWGKYSHEISEYEETNILQQLSSKDEDTRSLLALVDPYLHRHRITVPKLIPIGTNDEYWPLDALNLYYNDLVGEKYILYCPNKGHDLEDITTGSFDIVRITHDWIAFFRKVEGKLDFPELRWDYGEKQDGVELSVRSDVEPVKMSVWTAESPTRDFRKAIWQESRMATEGSIYKYTLKKPDQGYAAIFSEAVYKADGREFFLSTNVYILEEGR